MKKTIRDAVSFAVRRSFRLRRFDISYETIASPIPAQIVHEKGAAMLDRSSLLLIFFLLFGCTKTTEKDAAPVRQTEMAKVVPSGERVVASDQKVVPMGTSLSQPPGPPVGPGEKDQKQVTLASLNSSTAYVPAAGDISPEGFNWMHRDLALVFAGAIYEHGLSGKWRDQVLKERGPALDKYLASLRAISRSQFDQWAEQHRVPFLINAYHAHVLKLMVEQDFKGLSDKLLTKPGTVQLFASTYSLEQFVAQEIRSKVKDPRVFLALYCFSAFCPELRNSTYNAKNLEGMLTSSTNRFLRNEEKNPVDLTKKTLTLSPVIYGYKDLIEHDGQTLAGFVAERLGNEQAAAMLKKGELELK